METPAGLLLVDPGPESSLANLVQGLNDLGFTLSDVAAVLLTHIHLDHAGATGTLVARNRRIRVFVHRRGARHMADPDRLLRSARRIYGDRMDELWGEFLPVPEDNIESLSGGETIGPGGRTIDVRYTPGHAIHHVTFFDRESRTAFVGDTTGMAVSGADFVVPVTPPPDVDLDAWPESLRRIRSLAPERLFLTHFGVADDPVDHIDRFEALLFEWADAVRELLRSMPDPRAAGTAFRAKRLEEFRANLDAGAYPLYEQFADPGGSFAGLARYCQRR